MNAEIEYDEIQTNNQIWNITKTPGTSIVGGPFLGGNYWANLLGTGLSETCDDLDNDGICEAQRKLNEFNIDYLPITA